jgi:uncharacterized protein (TIGR03083 family)
VNRLVAPDRVGPGLATPVPSCPGWTVGDVLRHLGGIHRWATAVVSSGEPAAADELPAVDEERLAPWFADGGRRLVETLGAADLDATCWTFGPPPRTAGFWLRRQAHETAMHRWDVQSALGLAPVLPVALAEDAVDEVATMFFPRQVRLGRIPPLATAVRLESTVSGRAWTLAGDGTADAEQPAPAATVAADPATLALLLWHRANLDHSAASVSGDVSAAARTLAAPLVP